MNAVASDVYTPLPEAEQGRLEALGDEIDDAYMSRLETLVLDRGLVSSQKDLRIVYTPIHGTGGEIIRHVLGSDLAVEREPVGHDHVVG